MHQRRRGQQQIENHRDNEQIVMLCTDSRQNVEDEEVECDDEPNPPDNPAGPNVLPPDNGLLDEQHDNASVNTHAEEVIGLDGQESDPLSPILSASRNGSFQS